MKDAALPVIPIVPGVAWLLDSLDPNRGRHG